MSLLLTSGDLLIKMEIPDRYNCKCCWVNISEEEMLENDFVCPACGKNEGWLSDPVFVGDWDEEETERGD